MKFGNYTVRQDDKQACIDYERTMKDWFDIFLAFLLGFAAGAFIIELYVHTHFDKAIFWIVGLCFAFLALVKLSDGVLKLLRPARAVISLSKDTRQLQIRKAAGKATTVGFNEIGYLELKGKDIITRFKLSERHAIYITLSIVTKTGQSIPVLDINPDKIISASIEQTEATQYDTGLGLTEWLANETGVHYRWLGFERING